jgi:excisionase family DNA binding protein
MVERKIYCNVLEGAVYEDRCLFKLSKILEGNKSCENCILRELEKIKLSGAKRTYSTAEKRIRPEHKGPRQVKKEIPSVCLSRIQEGEMEPIKDAAQITRQSYRVRDLVNLLGKSERRIRELAKEGKVPARKIGKGWQFSKEEIDQWLSRKRGNSVTTVRPERQQGPEMPSSQAPAYLDPEPMER